MVFVPTDLPVATNSNNNNNTVSRRAPNFIIIILSNVESVGRPPSPHWARHSHCIHAKELINCCALDLNSDHTRPNTFSRLMILCTTRSRFTLQYIAEEILFSNFNIPNRIQCVLIALSSALETFHSPLLDWIWHLWFEICVPRIKRG